ncbi:hypothetical protein ACFW17_21870 [Streptomyces sp. NPDC058961]|uniref:hypothetical protein n=1 Tax=Streptomyces sp. NPDC058961 TaxID=3346680 RepID=UPI003681EF42
MSEDVNDRWHATEPEAYLEKLAAEGKPAPKLCGCRPGQIPLPAHGCARRWRAEWRDADGKQRYKNILAKANGSEPGGKTYAKAFQRSQRSAVSEGRTPTFRTRNQVGPRIDEYVETFLAEHDARSGTLETYGYRLRPHVVPVLGHRSITEVKRPEYKQFFNQLRTSGMKDGVRAGVKKALSAMLTAAMDDPKFGELMPGNQVQGIRISPGRREKPGLRWQHIVALAEEIHPRYELLIWYGALQGLRSMEATGVRDTDMRCRIRKLVVEQQNRGGAPAPLKTGHSYATMAMGSFLVERFVAHMARWRAPLSAAALRKRERRGLPPIDPQYAPLVTVTRYWTPVDEKALSRAFNRARDAARAKGVMVPQSATFRDLRDFMDAVLIASNVAPRTVQSRMRHGTLAETLDTYGFALEVDWENAPGTFEELFGFPAPPGLPSAAIDPQWRAARQVKDLVG